MTFHYNCIMRKNVFDLLAILFTALYGFAGSLVSLHRFWQYDVFYYDFGIFDGAIWRVSRFAAPVIDHLAVGGKVIFADHISPTIFLLSPLYWITSRSEIILIAQAVIVASSVPVLYRLGIQLLNNRFLAFANAIAYALFIGIQNAIISDFHETTILTLPLIVLFYAIAKGWKRRFFIFLILCLGIKENMFLLGASIGLFLWLTQKSWRAIALPTIALSLLWGFIANTLLLPYFAGRASQYVPTIPINPASFLAGFVDDPIKRNTLFVSFGSFLFLPLGFPPLYPAILQDLASRFFLPQSTIRWGLGLHYSAQLAPLLAVSSLYSLRWILKWWKRGVRHAWLIGATLLFVSAFLHYRLRGPLALSYNPAFYRHTKNFRFLDDVVGRVPARATVMTQNNLAARFSHQTVWLFRRDYTGYMPDYVVFDLRTGQNPNNFFPQDYERLTFLRAKLLRDPLYEAVFLTDNQAVFKRK